MKTQNFRTRLTAAITLYSFTLTTLAPSLAWAQDRGAAPERTRVVDEVSSGDLEASHDKQDVTPAVADKVANVDKVKPEKDDLQKAVGGKVEQSQATDTPVASGDDQSAALPTGGDKSGVTSQAISVPKGAGTIQGMGESFSAQLSTGIATFSVPFSLPAARGGAQPSLGLSYSSGSGAGLAGMGWSVGVPYIARQTDKGLPSYNEESDWQANQDHFVFNGGQELVPICKVAGTVCTGALIDEVMPTWAKGYQYFRPRVEGSFLRFFWSEDHRSWRVQDKSGITMELGVPSDDAGDDAALEVNPENKRQIFRWHLVRQYDTYRHEGKPVNVVVYKYDQNGGQAYLRHIYDTTPPTARTDTKAVAGFAHHTYLEYEDRSDPTETYRSGWLITQTRRLKRVDVTSKTIGSTTAPRHLVRRYHLSYDGSFHTSYLTQVEVEGRCATSEDLAPAEADELLGDTSCAKLPPMTFGYSHTKGFTTDGTAVGSGLTGYEAFDERLQRIGGSPPHSIDEELSDFFDINADALPDLLVTAPGVYGNDYGVFFNSPSGVKNSFDAVSQMGVRGVLGANSGSIKLSNLNVAPLDADGDGIVDFVHMPKVKTYSVYRPRLTSGKWMLEGEAIDVANKLSPKVDLGKDAGDTNVVDVNFDGLVDVVVTKGTEVQTYLSLGRLPGGNMQFGNGSWLSDKTAKISNDPIAKCVPYSGTPVRFSDGEIKLADINGDGIQDIVRLRRGDFRYWPGRGNGFWGTGKLDDCPAGSFGDKRYVTMQSAPYYSDIQGTSLRMDDVNGDGLDDLVQVRTSAVDVWLNVDGRGWTQRHIIDGTPNSPSYANRVRLMDINGSGTRDITWGDGKKYQYMDLAGGERPGLLVRVENGLGKSTDITYSSSTEEMLTAERSGAKCTDSAFERAWCTKMPTVTHLVKRVVESDNLRVAGSGPGQYVTEYSYRDPVYEGRQREFRGFRQARSKRVGDANSPTDLTESTFLLGECEPEPGYTCERWEDNPKEALKGLPVITERFDEQGKYLSTQATTYRLRHLYTGRDGRVIRHAFASKQRSVHYDTAASITAGASLGKVNVELEQTAPGALVPTTSGNEWLCAVPTTAFEEPPASEQFSVPLRASSGHAVTESASIVDGFGNAVMQVDAGCVAGNACQLAAGAIDDVAAEEAICSYTVPHRKSSDTSGWLFRTTDAWARGSSQSQVRKQTHTDYTDEGAPTSTSAVLIGTESLLRSHPYGWAIQPSPPDTASVDGTRPLGTNTYDVFGNLTKQEGPSLLGRLREVSYDLYQQLPLSETTYTGGVGSLGLTTIATYDRGLSLVTSVTDANNLTTTVAYDSFGRLTSLTKVRPGGETAGSDTPPSVKVEYSLPSLQDRRAYSVIHTSAQDGSNELSTEYLESYSFVDGMGRARVGLAEADPVEDGGAHWIVSTIAEFDAKGAVRRKYLPFFIGSDPVGFPVADAPPDTQYGRQRYDAFGRQVQTFDVDGTVTLQSRYHALSTDLWDAADLYSGPHQGSYATTRTDGHGRTIETTERAHDSGAMDVRYVRTRYLPTGEPTSIARVRSGSPTVLRWMRYDSLGRLVLNVDPHTTANFSAIPSTNPSAATGGMRPWVYAYNDAGDLIGTSDARGCGQNFFYDGAGRLYGEDYSPCESSHWTYTPPNISSTPTTGSAKPYNVASLSAASKNALEVFYVFDVAPTASTSSVAPPVASDDYLAAADSQNMKGKLAAVHDRAATTWFAYDARGRTIKTFRKVSYVGAKNFPIANRYVDHWYKKLFFYDAADRPKEETTGVSSSQLKATDGTSSVKPTYTRRGTIGNVKSSYGDLVKKVQRNAEGAVTEVELGDAAGTTTHSSFDSRRRLRSVQTYRRFAELWSSDPPAITPAPSANPPDPTRQLLLQDLDYSYDIVGNPTEIRDWRTADEWPDGAKPVSRRMDYDDLYRVTRVDYSYPGGSDAWKSVHAADIPTVGDQRRAQPNGERIFSKRPLWQTFKYDWLGNTTFTDDDQHAVLDRSLGNITSNAATDPTKPRPYQFYQSKSVTGAVTQITQAGSYDDAGNLTWFNTGRGGTKIQCTIPADCVNLQYFYSWDEVGRMYWAHKVAPNNPSIFNLYDYSDQRVVKQYTETISNVAGPAYTTLYVFDSLEVRRAVFNNTTKQYPVDSATEVSYLAANGMRLARLHYEPETKGEPQLTTSSSWHAPNLHVFLNLPDHLGSISLIVDQDTGELVETRTYQPYGATESDYRPERWKGLREDYGFTGKEEDVELGLQYFGKRYLNPYLGRWISADPLAVHSPMEADRNLYAYVHGATFKATDPIGLADDFHHQGAPRPPASTAKDANATTPQAAPEGPPSTAAQFTSYPDDLRRDISEATAKCGNGVCKFGGFIASIAAIPAAFPGDLANTANTGVRALESFNTGHPVRGALETAQVVGNVLFMAQIVRSGASLIRSGSLVTEGAELAQGGSGKGFTYERTPSANMVAQTTKYGCGPACVRQWLKDLGSKRPFELEEIDGFGTDPESMASTLGPKFTAGQPTYPDRYLQGLNQTFIAHIGEVPTLRGHYVLIDKISNGIVYGRDPYGLAGLSSNVGVDIEMSLSYFRTIWANGGNIGIFKVR